MVIHCNDWYRVGVSVDIGVSPLESYFPFILLQHVVPALVSMS